MKKLVVFMEALIGILVGLWMQIVLFMAYNVDEFSFTDWIIQCVAILVYGYIGHEVFKKKSESLEEREIKQRLKLYRKMLWHWRWSKIMGYEDTTTGFCNYLSYKNLPPPYRRLVSYIELYEQKPEVISWLGFWFEPGLLSPRIKCLKKAIKLCKQQLNSSL